MAWRIVGSVKRHIETTAHEHFKETGKGMTQYVISREDFLLLMDELWAEGLVTEEMMEERHEADGIGVNTNLGTINVIGWPYSRMLKKEKART